MNREKQREIASKGGRAAHAKGTAHEFSTDEAREAGRKGGQAVSRNREHMAAIGRKGGMESGARARTKSPDEMAQAPGQQQSQQSMGQSNNPM
jgi:general stress protein YciG